MIRSSPARSLFVVAVCLLAASVSSGPAAEATGSDYGKIVSKTPAIISHPNSVRDLQEAVNEARAQKLRIVPRGGGNSTFGQSQSDGGMLLDLSGLNEIVGFHENTVEVQAGASWRDVLRATLKRGLTPPVLVDYLDLTVGGTLSVGGIGPTSFRQGMQIDQAQELAIVTGTGRLVRCSEKENAELFRAVRGGLGQFGVIATAKLKLVPAPERVITYKWETWELPSFLAAQRSLSEGNRFDTLRGEMRYHKDSGKFSYVIEASHFVFGKERSDAHPPFVPKDLEAIGTLDQSYWEYANRVKTEQLPKGSELANPWFNVFLPPTKDLETSISKLLKELAPRENEFGLYFLFPVRHVAAPGDALRAPSYPTTFLFSALKTTPRPSAPRAVMGNLRLHREMRASGGVRYPVDAASYSEADWRAHYGDEWSRLKAIRDKNDPEHLFGSDPAMFPNH